MTRLSSSSHYYKNLLRGVLNWVLEAGRNMNRWLMPVINRGDRFLLSATVTMNRLAKSIYEGGYKITAS
jgi:hypothetical protein